MDLFFDDEDGLLGSLLVLWEGVECTNVGAHAYAATLDNGTGRFCLVAQLW